MCVQRTSKDDLIVVFQVVSTRNIPFMKEAMMYCTVLKMYCFFRGVCCQEHCLCFQECFLNIILEIQEIS
jgi:hypothetical protein